MELIHAFAYAQVAFSVLMLIALVLYKDDFDQAVADKERRKKK